MHWVYRLAVRAILAIVISCLFWEAGRSPLDSYANELEDVRPPAAARLAERALLVAADRADVSTDDSATISKSPLSAPTFVAGERGLIFYSPNGHDSWILGSTPTDRLLTGVAASRDGSHAWAVGHDALILHSSDGGRTWIEQFSDPEDESPLFGIWLDSKDESRALAYGAYGSFYETRDGGKKWARRTIDEEGPHHYGFCETPAGSLYVAGEFGSLLRSGDRGETWTALESPYTGTLFGTLALPDESVLIFGLRGNLFRSTDHGDSWTQIETGTSGSILGGTVLQSGGVVLVGLNGLMLRSEDGKTFQTATRPDRVGHSTAIETANGLLLLGEAGMKLEARP